MSLSSILNRNRQQNQSLGQENMIINTHVSRGAIAHLDEMLLDRDGRIKLLPTRFYSKIPQQQLTAWCVKRARYTLPTVELILYLKNTIGDRKAIEIGSGNGDLYYHLGIPGTDSRVELLPDVQIEMLCSHQMPTNPPADVLNMDAEEAIAHFKPDIVIGSWMPEILDEEAVVRNCQQYIHIGNKDFHESRAIMNPVHRSVCLNFLVSRAPNQKQNVAHIWQNLQLK